MNCPQCKSKNMRVVITRKTDYEVIRMRKCTECGYRAYTIEYESYDEKEVQYVKDIINASTIAYVMNRKKQRMENSESEMSKV